MISKHWLTRKLKFEVKKIAVYSVLSSIPYYLTLPLKYLPLLHRVNYFFGGVVMGFAMAYSDTKHALKDCEGHHRVMGVTQEEISTLYDSRSDEEKRLLFP